MATSEHEAGGASARARVTVFAVGGTIASTGVQASTTGPVTPSLSGVDLVQSLPQLDEVATVGVREFRQMPSCDLSFQDVQELVALVDDEFDGGVDGVVVTQGTDTLEETSFLMDLLVRSARPVVVTGAMRNPTLAGPDGPANLLGAVRVAASPEAVGLGVLVVMNDEIHAARFVAKTHSTSTATFHSLNVGPIGWLVEGRARFLAHPIRREPSSPEPVGAIPAVALVRVALGDDDRLLAQIALLGYAGLVIEGFGAGHVPARVVATLADLAQRIPVVLASRTGSGSVLSGTYGFAGSERDLLSRGLVSAGFLDGQKARILLSVLLGRGSDTEAIRDAFRHFS